VVVVNDESTPVAGGVVAVSEESNRSLPDLYRSKTTDQYGYYDEWEDSEFLRANGAKGVTIEISDGDTKTADLQVIQLNSKTSQAE
jgi:hypothetical protein